MLKRAKREADRFATTVGKHLYLKALMSSCEVPPLDSLEVDSMACDTGATEQATGLVYGAVADLLASLTSTEGRNMVRIRVSWRGLTSVGLGHPIICKRHEESGYVPRKSIRATQH